MSPTSRSLDYARKKGWIASVCERYCSYTRRRFDLFGVFDLIVLDDQWGCIGVQTTSGSNMSSRVHKMEASSDCSRWLASGLRAEVWGWRQIAAYRKDGSRAKVDRWAIRIVRLHPLHRITGMTGSQGICQSPAGRNHATLVSQTQTTNTLPQ